MKPATKELTSRTITVFYLEDVRRFLDILIQRPHDTRLMGVTSEVANPGLANMRYVISYRAERDIDMEIWT